MMNQKSVYCHERDLEVEMGVGGDKTRNAPRPIGEVCDPDSINVNMRKVALKSACSGASEKLKHLGS